MATTTRRRTPFRIKPTRTGPARRALSRLVNPAIERAMALDRLNRIYHQVHHAGTVGDDHPAPDRFVADVLAHLKVSIDVRESELGRIPPTGPLIVVANHPFGAVDGLILIHILLRARPDAKVLANFLLRRIPDMRRLIIAVDPFGTASSTVRNLGPLKQAMAQLKAGGAIGTFPAGEVAHFHLRQRAVVDPQWSTTIGRLARRTGATVVPIYFHGRNSPLFNMLGMIHPRLRTIMLPRELLKKQARQIRVRIGQPIPAEQLERFDDDRRLTDYLRMRTYLLSADLYRDRPAAVTPIHVPVKQFADVIPEVGPERIEAELAALPSDARLLSSGEQEVYLATAPQIPQALQEIGRLREIAFRTVGEGTGKPLDLDYFDDHYLHLFIWNREQRHIVGAYRLGLTDRIVAERGIGGLYTSTLFDYDQMLLSQINPAVELGRSFVRCEYQKSYTPLMNLWKGIGRFVVRNPQYARLFGPVSISAEYHDLSRRLMARFLMANNLAPHLAKLCAPKNPMPSRPRGRINKQLDSIVCRDIDEVSDLIADIESQPRGVPILLKQYLRLGAQLLGFNIDPDFGDVLDGLMLVDLRRTDPRLLSKYLGKDEAPAFLAKHS